MKRAVAALLIAIFALASIPMFGTEAGAEPRGRGRSRSRGRGRGWGQHYQPDNPLGGFLGGILGGWLSNQLREDEEPKPNDPFYKEDEGNESR